ncbi:MAG: acyl--CoA ligase [Cellulosilyticum sp.]|nr:acyl--CoA ligase [Cellulosilyticum sp.]
MKKLADLFYETAGKFPDKIAIWCENHSLTYEQFSKRVSQYSNFLLENGIQYNDKIGLPMNNSIESVGLIFAAANLGIGLVPINPTLPIESIKNAFECGDVKHIIARKHFLEQYLVEGNLEIEGISICLDEQYNGYPCLQDALNICGERPIINQVKGNETLIITMTSGSTGNPKPIDLTQQSKYQRAMTHIKLYDISKEDVVLAATPLYHSLAERLVIMPLLIGATAVVLPRFTPSLWLQCVEEKKVSFTIAVSAQLSQIAVVLDNENEFNIESLRCLVSSSALLDEQVKNHLIDLLKCDFHEMYGTSETSTITNINFAESMDKKQSVGRVLPGAQIKILDDVGKELESGKIGEIACSSNLMCNGYYNKLDVFNQAVQNGYFRTGDMGYVDCDGYLYFSGRKKEVIITGGINVYPPDIEQCLLKMDLVAECAVFAYPDDKLGEVVAVIIVSNNEQEIKKRMVQVHCAKNLADFQQPHKIFFSNELPKNAMGKVMKNKLLAYVQNNYEC